MKKGYAIVTGASSGIGYEMADILAAKGYSLVIVARREDRLQALKSQLVEKYKVAVEVVAMDLSDINAAKNLHDYTLKAGLDVEILINNAGFGIQCSFLEQSLEWATEMMKLNIITLTNLTQLYAKDFIQRGGGRILQVSSGAAFVPTPYFSAYAATKSYVRHLGDAIGFELRNTNVSYSTLYPGFTATEFDAVAKADVPWLLQVTKTEAREVAEAGIKGMLNGKKSIVPGAFNKFSTFCSRILPRTILIFTSGKVMETQENKG